MNLLSRPSLQSGPYRVQGWAGRSIVGEVFSALSRWSAQEVGAAWGSCHYLPAAHLAYTFSPWRTPIWNPETDWEVSVKTRHSVTRSGSCPSIIQGIWTSNGLPNNQAILGRNGFWRWETWRIEVCHHQRNEKPSAICLLWGLGPWIPPSETFASEVVPEMGIDQWTFVSREGAKVFKEIKRSQDLIRTWTPTADNQIRYALVKLYCVLKLGFCCQGRKMYAIQTMHYDLPANCIVHVHDSLRSGDYRSWTYYVRKGKHKHLMKHDFLCSSRGVRMITITVIYLRIMIMC
jgi:hypothetical protein